MYKRRTRRADRNPCEWPRIALDWVHFSSYHQFDFFVQIPIFTHPRQILYAYIFQLLGNSPRNVLIVFVEHRLQFLRKSNRLIIERATIVREL